MFDFDHPFFKPLWVRIAVTGLALGWGLFELWTGSAGWAMIFLALGCFAAYRLFFKFNSGSDE